MSERLVRPESAGDTSIRISASELQNALNLVVLESLPLVSIGVGLLFTIFACSHPFILPPFATLPMTVLAAATALSMFICLAVIRHYRLSPVWAHPIVALLSFLILCNALLHLYLLSEPRQTTNLMVLLIGVGFLSLSTRWLVAIIATIISSWIFVMKLIPPSPEWVHFAFAIFTSTLLSMVIHLVRVQTLSKIERLRLQDRMRKAELAVALSSSELARQALTTSKQELEEMMRAVEQSEERFLRFTDLEGIAVYDRGLILEANAALARMFHYELPEIIGMNVLDLTSPSSRELIREKIIAVKEQPYEAIGLKKGGALMPIELSGKAVSYQGRKVGVVVIRDISERKAAEAERAELLAREKQARTEAEAANQVKDQFLATVSHELRTPLTAILGWARILRTTPFDQETLQSALETIERNAAAQAQLIEDLLDISRIITGKLHFDIEDVDLNDLVRAALETLRPAAIAKQIELTATLTEPCRIAADLHRLQQVVWNLLNNALKFTPEQGRIEISLEKQNDQVELRVCDSGQGIPPEFLPYVFDRFRQADSTMTRKFGGLGLGLAIVRHIVEFHGGSVRAESAGENQGATFIVTLPLSSNLQPSAPKQLKPITTNVTRLQGLHVLVVEDDKDTQQWLTALLSQRGARVTAVSSTKEAMAELSRERPDVLLTDIGLPDEDGYELIRRVRAQEGNGQNRLPAAALTAFAGEVDKERALSAGFQLHLAKPIDPVQLTNAIANLVKRSEEF